MVNPDTAPPVPGGSPADSSPPEASAVKDPSTLQELGDEIQKRIQAELPPHLAVRVPVLFGVLVLLATWLQRHLELSLESIAATSGTVALAVPLGRRVLPWFKSEFDTQLRSAFRATAAWMLSTTVISVLSAVAVVASMFVSTVTVIGAGVEGEPTVALRAEDPGWLDRILEDAEHIQKEQREKQAEAGSVQAAASTAPEPADERGLFQRMQDEWSAIQEEAADLQAAGARRASEGQRAQTLHEGEVIKSTRLTTPFGRPFVLKVEGYRPLAFDLHPGAGRQVRVPDDLELTPSVLARVPYLERGFIADGLVHLYRQETDGRRTLLGVARTNASSASVLFGHPRALPSEWTTLWERQLQAFGAGSDSRIGATVLNGWLNPVSVPLLEEVRPGDRIEAWFFPNYQSLEVATGKALVTATREAVQDCLMAQTNQSVDQL